jgi:hypothetical protein
MVPMQQNKGGRDVKNSEQSDARCGYYAGGMAERMIRTAPPPPGGGVQRQGKTLIRLILPVFPAGHSGEIHE